MEQSEEITLSDRFTAPLLAWYQEHRRILPWRDEPTPYRVWISEIMLQQTRGEAVKPYYERFIQEIPDIRALACVSEERLMKLWEGLGYYSRARNLRAAAIKIEREFGGELPKTKRQLMELSGIGAYTAGAIASIAYGQPVAAVDGNVLRVVSRLAAYGGDIRKERTKKLVAAALEKIYPLKHCGDFTQSLMELGAVICLPKDQPKCGACPVSSHCLALQRNAVDEYPYQTEKKPRKIEKRTVFLLRCGEKIAVRKRKKSGLLAEMWELPNIEGHLPAVQAEAYLKDLGIQTMMLIPEAPAKHIFTHIEWRMQAYRVECGSEAPEFFWADKKAFAERIALPSAFRYWSL